jgi:hypothetical protein
LLGSAIGTPGRWGCATLGNNGTSGAGGIGLGLLVGLLVGWLVGSSLIPPPVLHYCNNTLPNNNRLSPRLLSTNANANRPAARWRLACLAEGGEIVMQEKKPIVKKSAGLAVSVWAHQGGEVHPADMLQ